MKDMKHNESVVEGKRLVKLEGKLRAECERLRTENKKLAKENKKLRNENVVLEDANGDLMKANDSLRDVVTLQGERIKGEVAIGEFHKKSLESAESALVEKDARIVELCRAVDMLRKEKKKLKKVLREKCGVISTLNKEIEFQYKRRAKAECLLNAVDSALDVMKENVKGYGCLE